jgi:hypothetical protein
LPVKTFGLELVVVNRWRGSSDGVVGDVEGGRGDVVAHVLMHALGVEIGDVAGDVLGNLAVDADAALRVERGLEVRIDGVVSGNGCGG